jgi:tetratricopeptide (TPR) repeat protein
MRTLSTLALVLLCFSAQAGAQETEAMVHARRSYELSQKSQFDEAAAEMRKAVTAAPEDALFHSALAGILSRQGKLAEAKESFAEAVKLNGKSPALRVQLALKQWETGELENARDNLLLVLQQDKAQQDKAGPDARQMLEAVSLDWGVLLAREARWKAGLRVAKDTATRFPESASTWQMLGLFETRNQENVSAVESYKRALQLDDNCVDCAIGLGMAHAAAGQADQATTTFETALTRWRGHAILHQAYGVHLLRVAEAMRQPPTEALDQLRAALALNPGLAEARYQLGNLALQSGDVQDALSHLQAAADGSGSPAPKVFYALSRAWRRAGQEEKALEAMRRFQEARSQQEQPPNPR